MTNYKLKKIYFKITSLLVTSYLLLFSVPAALAASHDTVKAPPIPCVPNLPCITEKTQAGGAVAVRSFIMDTFGANFITGFLGITAATSVIFIIVGGMQMLVAAGNEETIKKGKVTILWAITGLVFSILAVAVVKIISSLQF